MVSISRKEHTEAFFKDLDKYITRAKDRYRGSPYDYVFANDVLGHIRSIATDVVIAARHGATETAMRRLRKQGLRACTAIYYVVFFAEQFTPRRGA